MSEPLPEVEIIRLDDPSVSGAAISFPERQEPLLVWPFRDVGLQAAYVLDHRTVLLVAASSASGSLPLVTIDATSGDVIQAATLTANGFHYRLSRDRRTLYVMGRYPHGLMAVDTATLTVRHAYDFAFMSGRRGRLARHEDYFRTDMSKTDDVRVFHTPELKAEYLSHSRQQLKPHALYTHELADGRLAFLNEFLEQKRGLVVVDVEAGTLEQPAGEPLEWREIVCFLGARLTLIANDTSSIPVSDGTDAAKIQAFGYALPNIREHLDVVADGAWRYGIALTVCDYRGEQMDARTIVVRMATASDLRDTKYSYLSDEVFDEGLRLASVKLANPHDRNLKERKVVRWDAQSNSEKQFDVYGNSWREKLSRQVYPLAGEPGGDAFWVWFYRDDCLRRVSYNGELGPLIRFEPKSVEHRGLPKLEFESDGSIAVHRPMLGTYRFHPRRFNETRERIVLSRPSEPYTEPVSHKAAFAAYVRARVAIRIVLAEWSRAECAKALREQKARIESNFEKLLAGATSGGRSLKFEYLIGAETCSEPDVFQRIVDDRLDIVRELREVLTTYLDKLGQGGEGTQPWYTSAVPALGYAMRALVLLDPSSTDILRRFMTKRDGEHETFCWGTIVPDLIGRHGWRDRATLRFGVFVALNIRWGGLRVGDPNCYGLFTAAAQQVSVPEFSNMIIEEIEQFEMVQQWNDQNEVWQLEEFCAGLNVQEPFQSQLLEALKAYLPKER